MRTIERLPESTHSSVRSGVLICDLMRIVEELLFNSLDAGATNVSVAVGVGSFYVKVLDNGSGISRDELVLIGERYATSKVNHLALMDDGTEKFGFHGEALCSISDVSLLEIETKARGKPNGYRKIIKNCKCLFLGINDDRHDVGTTVIVRDIFYNQPVRRKHINSSPRKVLDSIKMSVLRIALVHVNVSFKVVDVESTGELFHSGPSSSPLPILSSHFGIENSATFYKLNLSDGELKLSGYISDPCEILSLKAIQYVYINSRFICKGPIHKLLNQVAAKFDLLSSWQHATSSQSEKRNKYDVCPTFILNLHCPRSYYDIITFDQSRISVEFKDWSPVLTLIENDVMHLWTENISHDMPDTFGSRKKKCRKQNCQTPLDLRSPKRKKLLKNYDNTPAVKECLSSFGKPSRKVWELKKHQLEAGLLYETDYLSQSRDVSVAGYNLATKKEIKKHLSPCSVFSSVCVAYPYDEKEDGILSSALGTISPAYDDKVASSSRMTGLSTNCLKLCDDIHIDHDPNGSFLRSCSYERSLFHGRKSPARDENFELGTDDITDRKRWTNSDDSVVDQDLAVCGRDLRCNGAPTFQSSPMIQYDMHEISEFPISDLVKSSLVYNNNPPHSSKKVWECTSSRQSFGSGSSLLAADEIIGIKFLDDDDGGDASAIYKNFVEDCSEFGIIDEYSAQGDNEDLRSSNLSTKESWLQQNCSIMNFSPDNKKIGESYWGSFEDIFSPKPFKRLCSTDWSPLRWYGGHPNNCSMPSLYDTSLAEHECGRPDTRIHEMMLNRKRSSVRSHSAPPFSKGKKRYLDLADSSTMLSAKSNFQNTCVAFSSTEPTSPGLGELHAETRDLKCSQKSFGQHHPSPMERSDSFVKRPGLEMTTEVTAIQNGTPKKRGQFIDTASECQNLKEIHDPFDSGWKWRSCLPTAGGRGSDNKKNLDDILDISSDILQLASDSLVPKSIGRTCLENAKVLNQVDKKFIAIVAGKTLAMVDQHAADERIRLEELRHKVLSGEMKTITYLDAEQELVLPEIGYQLLLNYAEQIQTWGWICNIHSQDLNSFAKHLDFLHRQPTIVKLIAVPCILGVNLTDIDLLEFLQQLADTDGSSVVPPSVHSLLNNKACRGAIMFGDTLLPSECSLLVEELKRTSLCFQCAHGRPTTVPLVNLDLLHNKIAKLGSDEPWHSLHQHKLSLERSEKRLKSALC